MQLRCGGALSELHERDAPKAPPCTRTRARGASMQRPQENAEAASTVRAKA